MCGECEWVGMVCACVIGWVWNVREGGWDHKLELITTLYLQYKVVLSYIWAVHTMREQMSAGIRRAIPNSPPLMKQTMNPILVRVK